MPFISKSTTNKRQELFKAIVAYKQQNDGNSPSVRELGLLIDVASTSTINYYLHQLEKEGLIVLSEHRHKGIRVVGGQWLYEPDLMPEYRGVELPTSGAIAHVAPDITPETLAVLYEMMQIAAEQFAQAPNGPITQSLTDPIAK